jgi:phenylpropionate dioxygenase-like ring-hydroxylating dioxygenase large terminal subunit
MLSGPAAEPLRHYFHPVARADDIDGVVAVEVLGERFVVWRTSSGGLAAAPDRCPHREAPLSAASWCEGVLTCAYHGWRFGDGGRCVEVPSAGVDATVPPRAHLLTCAVEERYGLVWLAPRPPLAGIPAVDEDADPSFRRINIEMQQWKVSVGRMVDNFLDISHFPWVHEASFGAAADREVPPISLEPLGDFYGYRYEVVAANPAAAKATSRSDAPVVRRTMTTGYCLPFTIRGTIEYESGLRHVLLLCSTPLDDELSLFTFVVWRNDDHSVPAEDVIAFDRQIGEEDRVMLERIPGSLPLGQTDLVSVQSDRPSVDWRRRLRELLATTVPAEDAVGAPASASAPAPRG